MQWAVRIYEGPHVWDVTEVSPPVGYLVPPAFPSANGPADVPYYFSNQVQTKLEAIGLESPTWTYKYNSGANPIGFAIPQEKATHSVVREILKTAYELA